MPESGKYNKEYISGFESIKETISAIRSVRKNKDIPNKEKLDLLIRCDKNSFNSEFLPVLGKLCNLSTISFVKQKQEGSVSFMIGTIEYFIPVTGKIDIEGELLKLNADIAYNRGFLISIMKKLENERFVKNAPKSVLEMERKKKSDTESKIKSLEEAINSLNRHTAP
jgi:valyl-tRNA synthetase